MPLEHDGGSTSSGTAVGTRGTRRPMPAAGAGTEHQHDLQMPSLDVATEQLAAAASEKNRRDSTSPLQADQQPEPAVKLRRRRQQAASAAASDSMYDQDDEDNTWYLYLPGLIGAGTALLVVGVVSALSLSSWRKNQN